MNNKTKNGVLTVGEMKDKFLIQKDILPGYNLEKLKGLRGDGELNHGIRECKTGGWEAKPWGLDGLYLHMDYDEQTKTGWYDVRCRFRLCTDIIVRLISELPIEASKLNLYTEVIEADSKEEFLKIMQESIDSSWLYLTSDINTYDLMFRKMNYQVTVFHDITAFHVDFIASELGFVTNGNIISIHPIEPHERDIKEGILLCGFLNARDERTYQGALVAN